MKLTKPEINFIRTRILNKRWKAGNMNVDNRRKFLRNCLEKGIIDENCQPTDKAIKAYHKQM